MKIYLLSQVDNPNVYEVCTTKDFNLDDMWVDPRGVKWRVIKSAWSSDSMYQTVPSTGKKSLNAAFNLYRYIVRNWTKTFGREDVENVKSLIAQASRMWTEERQQAKAA